jgi:Rib/alpha/Esp surface antigen-like repeat protein
MAAFIIKKGDRRPSYSVTLTNSSGTAYDITGATGVTFRFKSGTSATISGAGVIVSASAGTVRYDWGASDTQTAGQYSTEVVVTYNDGTLQTFPSDGFGLVEIQNNLA